MITTNDLQDLRDGLADADADTLGATITDDDRVVYHQITVASTKNGVFSQTFNALTVSPAMSYVPAYLVTWSYVLHPEYFSHGGR